MIKSIIYRSLTFAALFFLIFSIAGTAFSQNYSKIRPLRDGFVIDSLDGKVSSDGEVWFFRTFEPLTDGKGSLSPQTDVQILPSSMLEKFISTFSEEKNSYRIWGKFTKYKDKNFIYLSYFLPVTASEVNEPDEMPAVPDANEEKIIPDNILALLRPSRKIDLAELKKPLSTESDGVIADRTGFLRKGEDGFYFDFDALGRKFDTLSLPLLYCESLEIMHKQQQLSPVQLRFKISAIVTSFKGKNYLLLQRAIRAYSHGNFAM
ncbi:MAG: hypothetical protein A2173_09380 [Planctomycetes bacterium RBG_13_44_8b]|nr:MAG: hypothetical protein A2173_09380 [Planctomycetes bacterium RBG_13_44_8b]